MLTSFRSRLIALLISLLALVQLASAVAVLNSMKQENYRQGLQALRVASNVFALSLEDRAFQLTSSVRILASDFGFKQAVATRENATIQSVLENHGGRINSDLSLLLSPQGQLLSATQAGVSENQFVTLIQQARLEGRNNITEIIEIDAMAYQFVLVPVRAPNIVAWVGMGFLLNATLAEKIKNVTGLDISFVNNLGQQMSSGVSTVPETMKRELFATPPDLQALQLQPSFTNDDTYLTLSVHLNAGHQWALLHLPFKPWLENYEKARWQLISIFAITLSLALISGWFAARSMVRPIQALVKFAQKIGRGQTSHTPQVMGEFAVLANTMEQMQVSIKKREQEIVFRSSHDLLTGLHNRAAVEGYLSEQLPRQHGCLVLLNIRQFKDINNLLGFENGDMLLQMLSTRLQSVAGGYDMLARLGADEFLLIHPSLFDFEQVKALLAQCSAPLTLSGSVISLKLSAGVVAFEQTTHDVNNLMRKVDIASNMAKQQPQHVVFYEAGQDENYQRELTIIRDLPTALEQGQLFMVYQPKVDLSSRRCVAAEALIRWVHPTLGFIPPDEFIGLLEHSGNIQQLSQWVIKTVIAQQVMWQQAGIMVQIAINLSANDLLDTDLPQQLVQAMQAVHLSPSCLALEVTESAVMADTDTVVQVLNALKASGFKLSIDDFGTGHSSLAYLRNLPVQELKIDRAFVKDIVDSPSDKLIVETTVKLAHGMGLRVTAEGLEDVAGLAILTGLGCDKVQGYFFSKPLPAQAFIDWLDEFATHTERWWPTSVDY